MSGAPAAGAALIRRLDAALAVSSQLRVEDVADVVAAGYRSIVCNRPDGEGTDQPAFEDVRREAQRCGAEARYLPVAHPGACAARAPDFRAALRDLPGPVLAYCRTGNRSALLWSLAGAAGGGGRQRTLILPAPGGAGRRISDARRQPRR